MTKLTKYAILLFASDKTRRVELGKFFLDISKYVATVVVVGSLASEKVNLAAILLGVGISIVFAIIGFLTLPEKDEYK